MQRREPIRQLFHPAWFRGRTPSLGGQGRKLLGEHGLRPQGPNYHRPRGQGFVALQPVACRQYRTSREDRGHPQGMQGIALRAHGRFMPTPTIREPCTGCVIWMATVNSRRRKILYQSEGGVGHGRNDLALGPDGMIYVIHGDSVHIPELIPNRTSPLRRKRLPYRPNEGHVLRMDKDGKRIEIFCGGLRNPYGIAFNRHGEAFTYDADAENDMGTPWYRPTRVKHLTSGSDFGWRAVTGSWPPYYPDHRTTLSQPHMSERVRLPRLNLATGVVFLPPIVMPFSFWIGPLGGFWPSI